MGSYTTPRDQATHSHIMPTHQTLRSLMGLPESEPEERRMEFITEPNGDLFRSITGEDLYMENDTLPLDFNDIFEVNKVPSSFHGKIEDKKHIAGDIIEEQSDFMTNNSVEPVSNLPSEEVDKSEEIQYEVPKDNIETLSKHTNHNLNNVMLENGMVVSLDVVASNTNTDTENHTDLDFLEILNIFENDTTELSTGGMNYSFDINEEVAQKINRDDVEDLVVKEDGLEHNAWKCRLYRARRKGKLENACSELSSLEKDNKRLKLTEEKMVSNIKKIRKYYIQSIMRGNFHINT